MPEKDLLETIKRISEGLSNQEAALPKLEQKLQQQISLPAARYHFTTAILAAFILFLIGIVWFVMAGGPLDRANLLTDILKSALLPLVTLMIGHYFGSKTDQ